MRRNIEFEILSDVIDQEMEDMIDETMQDFIPAGRADYKVLYKNRGTRHKKDNRIAAKRAKLQHSLFWDPECEEAKKCLSQRHRFSKNKPESFHGFKWPKDPNKKNQEIADFELKNWVNDLLWEKECAEEEKKLDLIDRISDFTGNDPQYLDFYSMDELEEMLNNHIEKSKKEAVLRSVLEKLFQKVGIHGEVNDIPVLTDSDVVDHFEYEYLTDENQIAVNLFLRSKFEYGVFSSRHSFAKITPEDAGKLIQISDRIKAILAEE